MSQFYRGTAYNGPTAGTGVLASAASGAQDFIIQNGGDPDSIFGNAGIDPEDIGPTTNISLKSYCGLFETAAKVTKNDNIGLWFGQQFGATELGLISYVAIHSQNMHDALNNFVNLFSYHQQSTELSLTETRGLLSLNYRIFDGHILERRQDAELSLGMFLNIFHHCLGPAWNPEEVHFEHPQPQGWRDHEKAFKSPVFFGQRANSLLFRKEGLDTIMPTADPHLLQVLIKCLRQVGFQSEEHHSVYDQIRDFLLLKLPEGCPTLKQTADALSMPSWTIQRRLEAMNKSYKDVVMGTRQELALSYLNQHHLQLTEIAFLLGFSELSAFTRAFKRWTGISPSQYRQQLEN
jgi:AraC-like DNA-binding protein